MEVLNLTGHAISNEANNLDAGCKALLGTRSVAAFVVKHCVQEYRDMSIFEIARLIDGQPEISIRSVEEMPEKIDLKNTESKTVNEGTVLYDVVFKIKLPNSDEQAKIVIDIEAQNVYNPGYALLSRGVFYMGRLISAQKEVVFKNSEYDKIQKVYSIWLCVAPDAKLRGVLNRYELQEECLGKEHAFPKKDYDKMCLIIACLGDIKSHNTLIRVFSSIFNKNLNATEKLQIAKECGIKVTKKVEGGIKSMCDYSSYILDQGRSMGRNEGIKSERVTNLRTLMSKFEISYDEAADALDLSDVDREELKDIVFTSKLQNSEK